MQGSMVIIVKGYYQPIANPQHFLRHIARHHDPDQLSIGEVRQLAQRAGIELDKRFWHLLIDTKPMHARRARTVESRAKQIAGVLEAVASPAGVLRIEFDRLIVDEVTLNKLPTLWQKKSASTKPLGT